MYERSYSVPVFRLFSRTQLGIPEGRFEDYVQGHRSFAHIRFLRALCSFFRIVMGESERTSERQTEITTKGITWHHSRPTGTLGKGTVGIGVKI